MTRSYILGSFQAGNVTDRVLRASRPCFASSGLEPVVQKPDLQVCMLQLPHGDVLKGDDRALTNHHL